MIGYVVRVGLHNTLFHFCWNLSWVYLQTPWIISISANHFPENIWQSKKKKKILLKIISTISDEHMIHTNIQYIQTYKYLQTFSVIKLINNKMRLQLTDQNLLVSVMNLMQHIKQKVPPIPSVSEIIVIIIICLLCLLGHLLIFSH